MIFNDAAPFPWLSWVLRNVAGRFTWTAGPAESDYFGTSDQAYVAALGASYREGR